MCICECIYVCVSDIDMYKLFKYLVILFINYIYIGVKERLIWKASIYSAHKEFWFQINLSNSKQKWGLESHDCKYQAHDEDEDIDGIFVIGLVMWLVLEDFI